MRWYQGWYVGVGPSRQEKPTGGAAPLRCLTALSSPSLRLPSMPAECPANHELTRWRNRTTGLRCDDCGIVLEARAWRWSCTPCDYDICEDCKVKTFVGSAPAQPPIAPVYRTAGAVTSATSGMRPAEAQRISSASLAHKSASRKVVTPSVGGVDAAASGTPDVATVAGAAGAPLDQSLESIKRNLHVAFPGAASGTPPSGANKLSQPPAKNRCARPSKLSQGAPATASPTTTTAQGPPSSPPVVLAGVRLQLPVHAPDANGVHSRWLQSVRREAQAQAAAQPTAEAGATAEVHAPPEAAEELAAASPSDAGLAGCPTPGWRLEDAPNLLDGLPPLAPYRLPGAFGPRMLARRSWLQHAFECELDRERRNASGAVSMLELACGGQPRGVSDTLPSADAAERSEQRIVRKFEAARAALVREEQMEIESLQAAGVAATLPTL